MYFELFLFHLLFWRQFLLICHCGDKKLNIGSCHFDTNTNTTKMCVLVKSLLTQYNEN